MADGAHILRTLLNGGAITADDLRLVLLEPTATSNAEPTHSEFVRTVENVCPPASLRTYRTTFRRLVVEFGNIPVDLIQTTDLAVLGARLRDAVSVSGRGTGRGAEEGFIHGARMFYRVCVDHGHRRDNPGLALRIPRGAPRVRRALTTDELNALYSTVAQTSNDVDLDLLLLDFHRETAARRGGAIALRIRDLNHQRGSVLLREKGNTERETPCSREILERIITLWRLRTSVKDDDGAFRYRNGSPLTRRRYNTIFDKVQEHLDWAERLGVSAHWIRHTTLTDVSKATNGRIAAAYAGHVSSSTTDGYTVPTFEDLVASHDLVFPAFMIGEPLGVKTLNLPL